MPETGLDATAPEPAAIHPGIAEIYRRRVAGLRQALNREDSRAEAAEILRGLIDEIRLLPAGEGVEIELFGELGAIPQPTNENLRRGWAGVHIELVAGARNHLYRTIFRCSRRTNQIVNRLGSLTAKYGITLRARDIVGPSATKKLDQSEANRARARSHSDASARFCKVGGLQITLAAPKSEFRQNIHGLGRKLTVFSCRPREHANACQQSCSQSSSRTSIPRLRQLVFAQPARGGAPHTDQMQSDCVSADCRSQLLAMDDTKARDRGLPVKSGALLRRSCIVEKSMICVARSAIAFATVGGHAQSAVIGTAAACTTDKAGAGKQRGSLQDKRSIKRKKVIRPVKSAR